MLPAAQPTVTAFVLVLSMALCEACGGVMIEPGHRGLLFDPKRGLQHELLDPGYHHLAPSARIDDYDVTYTTRTEAMTLITTEGLSIDLKLAVIYRPIVADLYELDTEIGRNYYDEVVGPEFRSATRQEVAKHSFLELTQHAEKLEDEIEAEVRRRIVGKHIELASVTLESVHLPPEIVAAVRERLIAEQKAQKEKAERERTALEAEEKWAQEKRELEHDVERRRLQREAEGASSPAR